MVIDSKKEIANYLLNNCFLVGTEDSMREKYYYVTNHEDEFRQIFEPIGYTLVVNRGLKVVQLINQFGLGRITLKKYESVILLIIQLLYIQKRESLKTNAERVLVSVAEIKVEYEKLNLPKKFERKMLEEWLKNIRRYNLATAVDRLDTDEAKIQIFPSIMMALPDNMINQGYEEIRKYLGQYESSAEDE